MAEIVKSFRSSLELPENAEKRQKYLKNLKNQRNYNKNYIKRQMKDPEAAKLFRTKRNEQLRQCRIRKQQNKQKDTDDIFANKTAKSRALTKTEMSLPKSLGQKLIIINELHSR